MQYCCKLANVFLIFSTVKSVPNTVSGCTSFLIAVKQMATSFPGYKCHFKCRSSTYPGTNDQVKRFPVPDDKCEWKIPFPDYTPANYTAPGILKNPPWADKDAFDKSFQPKWNELDGVVDRCSHVQKYDIVDGVPRNPVGRTGISGRGLLGRWGPNHAADPIVTRWKRKNGNIIQDCNSGKPILQFVTILRKDCREWAIPGGMVDAGENVSITLKREFGEEAMNSLEASPAHKIEIEAALKDVFSRGKEVFRGYVDDPRNTDNSWMETVAVNFHDDNGSSVGKFDLTAGDDAGAVKWIDISQSLKLYASHRNFIQQVAELHGANW